MAHYILQIIAFQLLFLVVYDLFFKKELYFNWNRMYLILAPVLSFILPLIKIDFIRQNIPSPYVIQLPAILLGANTSNEITTINLDEVVVLGASSISTEVVIQFIWLLGMLLSLGYFIFKLYKIKQIKQSGFVSEINNTTIVCLPKTDKSFSFLNTIFLGENLSEEQKETILLHEKIHIEQRHSFDLLFFEMMKIIFWFNPLIYVFQNKMTLLQEYIADKKVASVKGKKAYYQGLLSQVFKTEKISFINTFFNHSLIKKRIIMLQKSNSNRITQLKYLLLVPVIGIMLVYTSCTQESEAAKTGSVSEKIADLQHALESEEFSIEDRAKLMMLLSEKGHKVVELRDEKDIDPKQLDYAENIPFSLIEKSPTYPGCLGTNEELKKCMSQQISKFVNENFNIKLAEELGLTGRQRITVLFKIDKTGSIAELGARAAHPDLVTEAERVVSLLPKMKPGEHKNKQVGVLYTLPIIFEIVE